MKVIIASEDTTAVQRMISAFKARNISTDLFSNAAQALAAMDAFPFDLLITAEHLQDMNGKALIERVITLNPMINCAVISARQAKDFHDFYEGLGVLMQFPPEPGEQEVALLLGQIDKILSLSTSN
ncbi:MAG: response regulator [Desulfobacteraceae bacterium]|nr:MAG: response regulator [Desulfobacteraceae bacterium]